MYIIDNDLLQRAKPTTIVMHPLPRNKWVFVRRTNASLSRLG
jgi:aspartate carbamoyltransferase catalytic subunit